MGRVFFDWQNRPKVPVIENGKPVPLLDIPDGADSPLSQKEFARYYGITKNVRRSFLDARAQYAGYKNYDAWLKARRTNNVERQNTAREVKKKTFRSGKVYIFPFYHIPKKYQHLSDEQAWKKGVVDMTFDRYEKQEKAIDQMVHKHPEQWAVQVFCKAFDYNAQNQIPQPIPPDWPWHSRAPMRVGGPLPNLKDIINIYGSVVQWLRDEFRIENYEYEKPPTIYTDKNGRRVKRKGRLVTTPGVWEIQLAFWDLSKK